MSSMRWLAKLTDEVSKHTRITTYRIVLLLLESYCLVEWDEPGNPRNVVARKAVTDSNSVNLDDIAVGSVCYVEV